MAVLPTLVVAILLISLLHVTSAQQIFQKHGENYNAKVTIHRNMGPAQPPPYPQPNQPGGAGPSQARPWKQGDRITLQEVTQNLARALLDRRGVEEEKRAHWREDNARKLQEYTLHQARLAKKQRLAQFGPNQGPPPGYQPAPGRPGPPPPNNQPGIRNPNVYMPRNKRRLRPFKNYVPNTV